MPVTTHAITLGYNIAQTNFLRPHMRLRHIEVFHAIYTSGSITNAAKMLHVSQPSVSKVLAHAEMQLGFLLFERVKGRLIPTNEAVLLFEEVNRVYLQMGTIKKAAQNIRNNEVGRISIASSPALGFDVIPEVVAKYRKLHPHISFSIETLHNKQVKSHLLEHKSELAIMFSPDTFPGIKEVPFGQGKVVAVYHKSMFPCAPSRLSLEEISEHPLIGIWGSGPVADLTWSALDAKNIKASSGIKVQTYYLAVNLVKHGAGLCLVDEFTARSQLSEDIGVAELSENLTFSIKGMYLENRPLSRATTDFISHLKKSFNSTP